MYSVWWPREEKIEKASCVDSGMDDGKQKWGGGFFFFFSFSSRIYVLHVSTRVVELGCDMR